MENITDSVVCQSADGWSLHAPGSTDEDIASGDAPYLVCGEGEPTADDYAAAEAVLSGARRRYAVLDINSGYIWGVADAETPCDACRIVDETTAHEYGRQYAEVSRSDVTAIYAVHETPTGWTCDDGQDPAAIDEVSTMPIAAYVAAD